ncbi:MAG: Uncharacterised protein [Rhodospirillaceae bacterium]|nr:MAG: Uncharacterised protein [Rhodospirillaceae bacterium]
MGGVADPVNAGHGPGGVRDGAQRGNIVGGADDVGAVREAHQLDPIVEQGAQASRVEQAALGVETPFAHFDTGGCQAAPGAGVGLVVLVGDDDGIAGAEVFSKGAGEDVGVLRGRGAEGKLIAFHPEGGGETVAGFVHLFTAKARGVIGAVGLHLTLGVEAGQSFDHRAAGVGAAGVLEEGLTVEHRLLQGRELLADEVDVKGRQGLGRHGRWNSETRELMGCNLAEDMRCAIFPFGSFHWSWGRYWFLGQRGRVACSGLGRFAAFGPPPRIFTENSKRCQAARSAACPLECAWEI